MKRILLFVLTNMAVMLTLSVAVHLLGLDRFLTARGMHFGGLLGFAAVFGFGGAILSLLMSKWTAKMSVGAQVIQNPRNATEAWLVDTVRRQAQAAGIGMPEVAIYASADVNAFATGASRNNALVAVSTGLLAGMTREEAEAVLAHEVSHIANGDMVTLTLIQGVLNTFVIFIARAVGYLVDRVLLKNEEGPGAAYFITHLVLEILLGILASVVVMWFSRQREFRADAGSARLSGRHKMIAALERLRALHEPHDLPEKMAAMGISSRRGAGFLGLFSSHPPLEERIEALKQAA